MKTALGFLLKLGVTLGIFVLIFLEFGGGWVPVDTAALRAPGTFEAANPAYPGIVGRLRARLTGAQLPPPRLPVTIEQVCVAAAERAVFVRTAEGDYRRFKPGRHCGSAASRRSTSPWPMGGLYPVPLVAVPTPTAVFFRLQGSPFVPAGLSELWGKIRGRG